MNTFARWLFKRLVAREVIQGYDHARNIEYLYAMIREKCEEEFTEDNAPTMDSFLRERFEATQTASALVADAGPPLAPLLQKFVDWNSRMQDV